jgi:cytochrome c peroxidase
VLVLLLIFSCACGGGGGGSSESETVIQEKASIENVILSEPEAETLPLDIPDYVTYAETNLPQHFKVATGGFLNAIDTDNTPLSNPLTNEGAWLGRTLFYDRNLSINNSISCGSCHQQNEAFSDDNRFSRGFAGERTDRHSPGLTHARFYQRGRFFWDERAATLEEQVLEPIQSPVEMGMDLNTLVTRMGNLQYYNILFEAAFGDNTITTERISASLSQFVRAMVSYNSRFDQAFDVDGVADFENTLTEQERQGLALFTGAPSQNGVGIDCSACHGTVAMVSFDVENIGLPNNRDDGAGAEHFKSPSLRNVAQRSHFMHDGRFDSLREVIDHYSDEIRNDPNLSEELRTNEGQVRRPRYNQQERQALIAFLRTLTDEVFLNSELFSNPFRNIAPRPRGDRPRNEADRPRRIDRQGQGPNRDRNRN